LTDQLLPIIAAIDFSCTTAPRNIFSGGLFDLSAIFVGVFMKTRLIHETADSPISNNNSNNAPLKVVLGQLAR
jgi:hypothetical protein